MDQKEQILIDFVVDGKSVVTVYNNTATATGTARLSSNITISDYFFISNNTSNSDFGVDRTNGTMPFSNRINGTPIQLELFTNDEETQEVKKLVEDW